MLVSKAFGHMWNAAWPVVTSENTWLDGRQFGIFIIFALLGGV